MEENDDLNKVLIENEEDDEVDNPFSLALELNKEESVIENIIPIDHILD